MMIFFLMGMALWSRGFRFIFGGLSEAVPGWTDTPRFCVDARALFLK